MLVKSTESSTSAVRGRMTTIARSSRKLAAYYNRLLQVALAAWQVILWEAGDETSPLGAATALAGRRSAEGTANPVAIKR
jgi:hypothetical protein